jgi:hypothetical protein
MTKLEQSDQSEGLANVSVNSSRRSGVEEDGTGNPTHESEKHDSTESIRCQISRFRSRNRLRLKRLKATPPDEQLGRHRTGASVVETR